MIENSFLFLKRDNISVINSFYLYYRLGPNLVASIGGCICVYSSDVCVTTVYRVDFVCWCEISVEIYLFAVITSTETKKHHLEIQTTLFLKSKFEKQ